jgi:hypothetical protein
LSAGLVVTGRVIPAAVCMTAALIPAGIRASHIRKRQLRGGLMAAAQALAVAVVFDLARALAIIAGGSHRARRAA